MLSSSPVMPVVSGTGVTELITLPRRARSVCGSPSACAPAVAIRVEREPHGEGPPATCGDGHLRRAGPGASRGITAVQVGGSPAQHRGTRSGLHEVGVVTVGAVKVPASELQPEVAGEATRRPGVAAVVTGAVRHGRGELRVVGPRPPVEVGRATAAHTSSMTQS